MANLVLFGQKCCIWEKIVVCRESACNWAKLFFFGVKLVDGQNWLYLGRLVVIGQSGCIWTKVVVFGQKWL